VSQDSAVVSISFFTLTLKKNMTLLPPSSLPAYRLEAAVEPFYAGGAITLLPEGRAACACGDEVKVREEEREGTTACGVSFSREHSHTHTHFTPFTQIVCLETGTVELTLAGVS